MNGIQERLNIILKSSGYSLRGFAGEIGMTPGGFSGILSGRSKVLSGMFLKVLQYRFNVNPDWLQTGEGSMYVKKFIVEDAAEIEHIIKFRKLDREQRHTIAFMIKVYYEQKHLEKPDGMMVAEPLRKIIRKNKKKG